MVVLLLLLGRGGRLSSRLLEGGRRLVRLCDSCQALVLAAALLHLLALGHLNGKQGWRWGSGMGDRLVRQLLCLGLQPT